MQAIPFFSCLPSLTDDSERDHNDGNKYLSECRCLERAKGLWVCRCDIRGYSHTQRQIEAGLIIWESTRLLSTCLRKNLCLYSPNPARGAMTKGFWFLTCRFFTYYYEYYVSFITHNNIYPGHPATWMSALHVPLQVSFSFLLIFFSNGCLSDWLI